MPRHSNKDKDKKRNPSSSSHQRTPVALIGPGRICISTFRHIHVMTKACFRAARHTAGVHRDEMEMTRG